jgi:hypothetical protein
VLAVLLNISYNTYYFKQAKTLFNYETSRRITSYKGESLKCELHRIPLKNNKL